MKAEHRKELQTNLLADRMGRMIQGVKGRPSRRGVLIFLLVLVIAVGILIVSLIYMGGVNANAQRWVEFEKMASIKTLQEVVEEYPNTQQGKAARMQYAWLVLWNGGIKNLGRQPNAALEYIAAAREKYEELKAECKDDPTLGAEAMYGIAIAEESLACNPKLDLKEQLSKALDAYKELTTNEKFKKTAHASRADKRVQELEDSKSRAQIEMFYNEVRRDVGRFFQAHPPLKKK